MNIDVNMSDSDIMAQINAEREKIAKENESKKDIASKRKNLIRAMRNYVSAIAPETTEKEFMETDKALNDSLLEIEKILSVTKTKDTDTAKKKISLDDFFKELFD